MRIQGPDGKWYAGPFETERQAEEWETMITRLLQMRRIPPTILAALAAGLEHLAAAPGYFEVRAHGGPGVTDPKVEYAAGGTFKAKTA